MQVKFDQYNTNLNQIYQNIYKKQNTTYKQRSNWKKKTAKKSKMHSRITSSIALIVLTCLELCLSLTSLAEQTMIKDNSIFSNNNGKLTVNSKHLLLNSSGDHIKFSDKSEKNILQQSNVKSVLGDDDEDIEIRNSDSDHPNFLITNYLADGEIERRIHFDGVTAKETLVSNFRYIISFVHLNSLL